MTQPIDPTRHPKTRASSAGFEGARPHASPRPPRRLGKIAVLTLLALATALPALAEATYRQEIPLIPGWNTIFLEVEPRGRCSASTATACYADGDCPGSETCDTLGHVFDGVPIASVWTYDARFGGKVDSLVDPAQGLIDATGWFGYFPAWRDEAVLTNLFRLGANRPYLVKLLGDPGGPPVTLEVVGRPSLRRQRWVADSFNLVGFHVEPASPPSFGSWFEPSPSHAGQPVYRLDPSGYWQPVLPYFEPIQSGRAYWVWTRGSSDYQGPMQVELDLADRIDFGAERDQSLLVVRNRYDLNTTLRLELLGSHDPAPPLPLAREVIDGTTAAASWEPLPSTYTLAMPGEQTMMVKLAPRRAELAEPRVEQILKITDGLGSRRLVLVGADLKQATPQGGAPPFSPGGGSDFAGLWVGQATVRRVDEIRCRPGESRCVGGSSGGDLCTGVSSCPGGDCRLFGTCNSGPNVDDPCDAEQGNADCPDGTCVYCEPVPAGEPTRTGRAFDLRLIVHVDATGVSRLLKEVIQLFEPPTYGPDPDLPGYETIVEPGRYVLITDDELIPSYDGVALRDGVPVGVRLSTVAYDFDQTSCAADCTWDSVARALRMTGAFGASSGNVVVEFGMSGAEFPTHPFRHRYHPDHDNLDSPEFFDEVPAITRRMALAFRESFDGACDVSGTSCRNDVDCPVNETCEGAFLDGQMPEPPGWGADTVGGDYTEVVTGLHRYPIEVGGVFLLNRVAAMTEINPTPGGSAP